MPAHTDCPEALEVATLPLDCHSLVQQTIDGNPNCFQGVTEWKFYRKNWKEHVDRMTSDRIPKMNLKYQPKGKEI
jgi:hypothetical protein